LAKKRQQISWKQRSDRTLSHLHFPVALPVCTFSFALPICTSHLHFFICTSHLHFPSTSHLPPKFLLHPSAHPQLLSCHPTLSHLHFPFPLPICTSHSHFPFTLSHSHFPFTLPIQGCLVLCLSLVWLLCTNSTFALQTTECIILSP
jgi:hypothetical protein